MAKTNSATAGKRATRSAIRHGSQISEAFRREWYEETRLDIPSSNQDIRSLLDLCGPEDWRGWVSDTLGTNPEPNEHTLTVVRGLLRRALDETSILNDLLIVTLFCDTKDKLRCPSLTAALSRIIRFSELLSYRDRTEPNRVQRYADAWVRVAEDLEQRMMISRFYFMASSHHDLVWQMATFVADTALEGLRIENDQAPRTINELEECFRASGTFEVLVDAVERFNGFDRDELIRMLTLERAVLSKTNASTSALSIGDRSTDDTLVDANELANHAGCKPRTIKNILNGKVSPDERGAGQNPDRWRYSRAYEVLRTSKARSVKKVKWPLKADELGQKQVSNKIPTKKSGVQNG